MITPHWINPIPHHQPAIYVTPLEVTGLYLPDRSEAGRLEVLQRWAAEYHPNMDGYIVPNLDGGPYHYAYMRWGPNAWDHFSLNSSTYPNVRREFERLLNKYRYAVSVEEDA